jgi:hypothetical protein
VAADSAKKLQHVRAPSHVRIAVKIIIKKTVGQKRKGEKKTKQAIHWTQGQAREEKF